MTLLKVKPQAQIHPGIFGTPCTLWVAHNCIQNDWIQPHGWHFWRSSLRPRYMQVFYNSQARKWHFQIHNEGLWHCAQDLCVQTWRLWLVSHESKVRNLNYHLNCAFWITQCTHDRSNCDIWITQCTHERPNLGFCIPPGEECLGTLPIKHALELVFPEPSVHMQWAVYRRKWFRRSLSSAPQITI